MITPKEIKDKALRFYYTFIEYELKGESFFPKVIPADKGKSTDPYTQRVEGLRLLLSESKIYKGFGYRVELKDVQTRKEGVQSIPSAIWIDSVEDFMTLIGKTKEYKLFKVDLQKIIQEVPQLEEWAISNVKSVIKHQGKWESIIKVCHYFVNNPRPNLYIRQLPIKVHTKFIEQNKGILNVVLEHLLFKDCDSTEKQSFEERFSLLFDEPIVRFRVLDSKISSNHFSGFSDISLPISEFNLQGKEIDKVFIAENKMNILTFPKVPNSIIIFGSGFNVNILRNVKWLNEPNLKIYYWGDLDIAGFQILSLLRSFLPHTESLMMNQLTWENFISESEYIKPSNLPVSLLPNLTVEEVDIYNILVSSISNNRLEQEKINQEWVDEEIVKLIN